MLHPSVQTLYCHIHWQQLVVGFHVQLRLLNDLASVPNETSEELPHLRIKQFLEYLPQGLY